MSDPGANPTDVSFRVPVLRWSAWPAARDQASLPATGCDVAFVEPLLRRRLSGLARMALHVAHECTGDTPRCRLVFASRHGELNRTMSMLGDLAHGEGLSPTAFGLSVHNAAAGIFSIVRQDSSPATAVAAGEETLAFALLEACIQLEADPGCPILIVYADEPLPEPYAAFSERREHPHAIALVLHAAASRWLTLTTAPSESDAASAELQSDAFLRTLSSGKAGQWTGALRTWNWH